MSTWKSVSTAKKDYWEIRVPSVRFYSSWSMLRWMVRLRVFLQKIGLPAVWIKVVEGLRCACWAMLEFLTFWHHLDRKGDFEPELIGKRERELNSGLDDQILALYAQGNSLEAVTLAGEYLWCKPIFRPDFTDYRLGVAEIQEWRTRSLQSFYPFVYLDAIHFKVRQEGKYTSSAFYTVYSVDWEGNKDVLGLYVNSGGGGAKK